MGFPDEYRRVPEMPAQVYAHEAEARGRGLTPEERLRLHHAGGGSEMDQLHGWLEAQLAERKTEHLLRAWRPALRTGVSLDSG